MADRKRVQLLILENQVMNGFCYAFSKALLDELLRLQQEEKLADDNRYTDAVISHLSEQINLSMPGSDDIPAFIVRAQRFLAIFEEQPKSPR